MKQLVAAILFLLCSLSVSAQKPTPNRFTADTIELISPWIIKGDRSIFSNERHLRACFNFILLAHGCGSVPQVAYGDRVGINWDLFQISGGKAGRTRMIEIGKYDWDDKFTVPYVEPWPALKPGERRTININASGGSGPAGNPGPDGEDGVVGMNGDGTFTPIPRPKKVEAPLQPVLPLGKSYATANVKEQVTSTVKDATGKVRSDPYTPVLEVKKGYMYVVRVFDESHDFYVIIHVDDVQRGEWVKLSYWKVELP